MSVAYIFLIAACCILLAMAIESVLKSTAILNVASALLLVVLAAIIGVQGLKEFFLISESGRLALWMVRIQNSFLAMTGVTFFFFASHFPRDRKADFPDRYTYLFLFTSFIAALVVLFGLDISRHVYIPAITDYRARTERLASLSVTYNLWHFVIIAQSVLLCLYSLFSIGMKYPMVRLIYQKKQIRYFMSGMVLFIVLNLLVSLFKNILPLSLNYFLRAFAFVGAGGALLYSIISYRFVNLRKRLVSWGREFLIGCVISLFFAALLFVITPYLTMLNPGIYIIVMAPMISLAFWLYKAVSDLVKRLLRIEYGTKDATEFFLDRIGTSRNIEELAQNSIDVLTENINCRNADFLFFDRQAEVYQTIYSSNKREYSISAIDPFFRRITPAIGLYDREIVNLDPRFTSIKDIAERYFERYETALIAPIFYENNISVLINISRKLDNTTYTSQELVLITKLKRIIEIILHNIILFDKEQEAKITKRDLSLASNIQEAVFQRVIPEFPGMDVHAYQKPAKGVSGDYFLIEKANDNAMGVMIADVSGKGFPAALISMIIHTIAKSQDFASTTTNAIVSKINEVMTSSQDYARLIKTLNFATIFCGYFDNAAKNLYYTNAGHHPMIIFDRGTRTFDFIKANSKPAGIFPDEFYITESYPIHNDKIYVLYSDGITESINSKEEEFGLDRLLDIIRKNASKPSRKIVESIISEVEDYADQEEQFDDITLIVIKL